MQPVDKLSVFAVPQRAARVLLCGAVQFCCIQSRLLGVPRKNATQFGIRFTRSESSQHPIRSGDRDPVHQRLQPRSKFHTLPDRSLSESHPCLELVK
jgi:hypothetical protein